MVDISGIVGDNKKKKPEQPGEPQQTSEAKRREDQDAAQAELLSQMGGVSLRMLQCMTFEERAKLATIYDLAPEQEAYIELIVADSEARGLKVSARDSVDDDEIEKLLCPVRESSSFSSPYGSPSDDADQGMDPRPVTVRATIIPDAEYDSVFGANATTIAGSSAENTDDLYNDNFDRVDAVNPFSGSSQPLLPAKSSIASQFVGVQNIGNTCYLISTIQCLFHIPRFRELIYNLPVQDAASANGKIVTALQDLFYGLQTGRTDLTMGDLMTSFGWSSSEERGEQHDAHEMLQKLHESLEVITKGTPLFKDVHELFYGSLLNYAHCLDESDYVSKNPSEFMDLELVTVNVASMHDALVEKTKPNKLDGKYRREYDDGRESTMHDAEMGCIFTTLPPILAVHPSRATFCMRTFQRITVETPWTFAPTINFSQFIYDETQTGIHYVNPDGSPEGDDPQFAYELHSIIIHSGGAHSGHYYAYIYKHETSSWICCNDGHVSDVSEATVFKDAFSEPTMGTDYWGYRVERNATRRASLLFYTKVQERDALLTATITTLPSTFEERAQVREQQLEAKKAEEARRASLMTVHYLVADTEGKYVCEIGSSEKPSKTIELPRNTSGRQLVQDIAEALSLEVDQISCLWSYPAYFYPDYKSYSKYYDVLPVCENETLEAVCKDQRWLLIQMRCADAYTPAYMSPESTDMYSDNPSSHDMDTKGSTPPPANDKLYHVCFSDGTTLYFSGIENDIHDIEARACAEENKYITANVETVLYKRKADIHKKKMEERRVARRLQREKAILDRKSRENDAVTQSEPPAAVTPQHVDPCKSPDEINALDNKIEPLPALESIDEVPAVSPSAQGPPAIDAPSAVDEEAPSSASESEADFDVTLSFSEKWSAYYIHKHAIKPIPSLASLPIGVILILAPSTVSQQDVLESYEVRANPLDVNLLYLDDNGITSESFGTVTVCPSFNYVKLQRLVFDRIQSSFSTQIRGTGLRRPDQIGFRCHDPNSDLPHRNLCLLNQYASYAGYTPAPMHTAQTILSNRTSYIISKLYFEVLSDRQLVSEMSKWSQVQELPVSIDYFFSRSAFFQANTSMTFKEVISAALAQISPLMDQELRVAIMCRFRASLNTFEDAQYTTTRYDDRPAYLCQNFDPVFRLVRKAYNSPVAQETVLDWSQRVTFSSYHQFVLDLLPDNITAFSWDKRVLPRSIEVPKTAITAGKPAAGHGPTPPTFDGVVEGKVVSILPMVPVCEEEGRKSPQLSVDSPKGDADRDNDSVAAAGGSNRSESPAQSPDELNDTPVDTMETLPAAPQEDIQIDEKVSGGDAVNRPGTSPSVDVEFFESRAEMVLPVTEPGTVITTGTVAPVSETPVEEEALYWFDVYHADRRQTDGMYGHPFSVLLPNSGDITGHEIMGVILARLGIQAKANAAVSPAGSAAGTFLPVGVAHDGSGASVPSTPTSAACGKWDSLYDVAMSKWSIAFHTAAGVTKRLEPKQAFNEIIGALKSTPDYIILDHPQETQQAVPRQRGERAIRINVISDSHIPAIQRDAATEGQSITM